MTEQPKRPTKLARQLRNNATDAERQLWKFLRGSQLADYKFSRQIPIGPFICDFVCRRAMLVVEVDGGQHDENRVQDDSRTRKIETEGYRVIRFWNNDVLERTEGVLIEIEHALRALPTPQSPPRWGGEAR
jgi:very-short-patch-repair endonuclease